MRELPGRVDGFDLVVGVRLDRGVHRGGCLVDADGRVDALRLGGVGEGRGDEARHLDDHAAVPLDVLDASVEVPGRAQSDELLLGDRPDVEVVVLPSENEAGEALQHLLPTVAVHHEQFALVVLYDVHTALDPHPGWGLEGRIAGGSDDAEDVLDLLPRQLVVAELPAGALEGVDLLESHELLETDEFPEHMNR